MIELTEDQRQRLKSGKAVDVIDPETKETYVVLGKEVFDRVRQLLYDDSDWTDTDLRMLLARSAKDIGWDEPEMEAYDRYDEELQALVPEIEALIAKRRGA